MSRETQYLHLPLISSSDYPTTRVIDMIDGIEGDKEGSAFNIIDSAVNDKQNKLVYNPTLTPTTPYVELTTLKDGDTFYLLTGTGKGGTWGQIIGDINTQSDLLQLLSTKANTFSPTFSGSVNVTGSLFINYNTSTSSGKEVATKQDITNAMTFATDEEIDALDYNSPSLNEDVLDILGGSY